MLGLPDAIKVALFDLDGVLTTTAVLHRSAWGEAFDAFLSKRAAGDTAASDEDYRPFTEQDYLDYVDGRPRGDGVRNFLASRNIAVDDPTADAIGEGKNEKFVALLERDGVTPYPGSVRYLQAVQAAGLGIAVVTSSKNGAAVLDAADLSQYIAVRVDGLEVARRGLPGKPAPDSYLLGAELMGVPASEAVVFEDALSGIESGVAGKFGYVVGIDRVGGTQAASMTAAGADIVVTDLDQLLEGGSR